MSTSTASDRIARPSIARPSPAAVTRRSDAPPAGLVVEAVRALRAAIMTGNLRPGQKLVEADLARDLDISRASVREVLRTLEGERLIELIPNRGPSVASLGPREVDDIEQVWAMLTGEAIARFARNPRRSELAALKRRLRSLRTALSSDRGIEAIDGINAFFWYIMQRCDNAVLLDVVVSLLSRLNFLRAQSLQDTVWRKACGNEIRAILSALETCDPEAARRAAVQHIASTCIAARSVALAQDAERGDGRTSSGLRLLPVIPLDEYLDRGLAKNSARPNSNRRRSHRFDQT